MYNFGFLDIALAIGFISKLAKIPFFANLTVAYLASILQTATAVSKDPSFRKIQMVKPGSYLLQGTPTLGTVHSLFQIP